MAFRWVVSHCIPSLWKIWNGRPIELLCLWDGLSWPGLFSSAEWRTCLSLCSPPARPSLISWVSCRLLSSFLLSHKPLNERVFLSVLSFFLSVFLFLSFLPSVNTGVPHSIWEQSGMCRNSIAAGWVLWMSTLDEHSVSAIQQGTLANNKLRLCLHLEIFLNLSCPVRFYQV